MIPQKLIEDFLSFVSDWLFILFNKTARIFHNPRLWNYAPQVKGPALPPQEPEFPAPIDESAEFRQANEDINLAGSLAPHFGQMIWFLSADEKINSSNIFPHWLHLNSKIGISNPFLWSTFYQYKAPISKGKSRLRVGPRREKHVIKGHIKMRAGIPIIWKILKIQKVFISNRVFEIALLSL